MIAFATTTAFRLVRRLVLGQGSTGMYLLIYDEGTEPAIETDLEAEVAVQMSMPLPIGRVSELIAVDKFMGLADETPLRVLEIDRWAPEIVALLDTHVIRLERTGAQFLFLATPSLAERLLVEAPNFRNRLTEVLRMITDDLVAGQR